MCPISSLLMVGFFELGDEFDIDVLSIFYENAGFSLD